MIRGAYQNQSFRVDSYVVNSNLVIYYEISSFFWTLLGVMKPSPSMGFGFQAGSRVFTTNSSNETPPGQNGEKIERPTSNIDDATLYLF